MADTPATGFGDRLAQIMQERQMTQSELAERVQTSQPAVSQWVTGKKMPSNENLESIAMVLSVRKVWLETGMGLPGGTDEASLRSQYMDAASLWFRPANVDGGRDYGNAAVWALDAGVDTLVREALQNARDQADPVGARVDVTFKIIVLRGDEVARFQRAVRWDELRQHLDASAQHNHKLGHTLRAGLNRLRKEGEVTLLVIEDRGTTGLVGPEFAPGNFMALCRNNLDSQKPSNHAGGAFGLGKAVLWRASEFSTVLFGSNLSRPVGGKSASRVIGRCDLAWHEVEGKTFAGPGWLGSPDPNNSNVAVSFWDNPVLMRDLYLDRPEQSHGTSICVVGFHDPRSDEPKPPRQLAQEIEAASANWFWPALAADLLTVTVETYEGRRQTSRIAVEAERLQPDFVLMLRDAREGAGTDRLQRPGDLVVGSVPLTVPKRPAAEPHGECQQEARLLVRRAADGGDARNLNHIALLRGARMVVKYEDLGGLPLGARPFYAALLCGTAAGDSAADSAAEQFLRTAEPPSHENWTSTPELKADYVRGGKARIEELLATAKERIRELVRPPMEDQGDGPKAVKDLFRIGDEPVEARERPRLLQARGEIDERGRWLVEARVRLKADDKGYRLTPVVLFTAETGGGQPVRWETLEVVTPIGVRIEGHELVVPPHVREVSFKGRTRVDSHPVPASESSIMIDLRRVARTTGGSQ